MKIASQAQAAFLGATAAGKSTKADGPSPAKARTMLRENAPFKMSDLPYRAPAARKPRRVSYRGGR